jgi:peptide methionine sulfoxide reductase MsrA
MQKKYFPPEDILIISNKNCFQYWYTIRDRPFNLKRGGGDYGFLFRSEIFFRTTRELEYFFLFVAQSAKFFSQISTLGYMTKPLNQIIIFFLILINHK